MDNSKIIFHSKWTMTWKVHILTTPFGIISIFPLQKIDEPQRKYHNMLNIRRSGTCFIFLSNSNCRCQSWRIKDQIFNTLLSISILSTSRKYQKHIIKKWDSVGQISNQMNDLPFASRYLKNMDPDTLSSNPHKNL